MSDQKKIFGTLEISIGIATLLLLAYIGLKGGSGKVYEKTETIEITDNPNQSWNNKQTRKYSPSDSDEKVDKILKEIAGQYSDGETDFKAKKAIEKAGMSKDEAVFLNGVKEKNKKTVKKNSTDWFNLLKASHKTYSNVKAVFEKAGIDTKNTENVTTALANEVAAQVVYSKIEELFDIPQNDAKAFAKKGNKAISDWARFVEDNTQ